MVANSHMVAAAPLGRRLIAAIADHAPPSPLSNPRPSDSSLSMDVGRLAALALISAAKSEGLNRIEIVEGLGLGLGETFPIDDVAMQLVLREYIDSGLTRGLERQHRVSRNDAPKAPPA